MAGGWSSVEARKSRASTLLYPLGLSCWTLKLTVPEDEFRMAFIGRMTWHAPRPKITCRPTPAVATACDIDRLKHSSGRLRRLEALFPSGLESS